MPKLLLNSIVKNESARILRMLNSVAPHISSWVITDTGSTDGTPEIIEEFFKLHEIPGKITRAPFIDFSQARNAALVAAQTSSYDFDYILLVDADMELKVFADDWTKFFTDARSYDMYQCAGMLHYQNRRLVRRGEQHGYLGVTHEYLNVDTGGCLPKEVAHFVDHADGSNRPDKFRRDIKLLKKGLKDEPQNARYLYYLAQSYRDGGDPKKAIEWYQKRVEAGGWDEEVWSAMLFIAICWRDIGKEAKFVRAALDAYNFRPQRAEALYEIAKYYREKNKPELSLIFAEAGIQIPNTTDALFVNDYVFQCGMWDEFAVTAFYSKLPMKKIMGFRASNMLSLKRGPYHWSRELARQNMYFYIPPLKELAPSWESKEIPFKAPENWIAMNPSVTMHRGKLWAIIRTVNYRMDEQGRYLIRGLADGTVNNSNPINTRNWLVSFDDTLKVRGEPKEIMVPADLPCGYPLVIGFEDMRLWSYKNQLWTNSTVRQVDPDGMAEQVLARIDENTNSLVDVKRMLRTPRLYEKNWANITGTNQFMYRPGHVVDDNGQDVAVNPPIWDIDHFSGGSQVVSLPSGEWLYLIHEARHIPGTQLRYYMHRFVKLDAEFKVNKVSVPFCLQDKVIEFVAGMCRWQDKLVISYGFKDCEAKIGTVLLSDVERFLNAS